MKGYYCTSALQLCDAALPCGGVGFYCPKGSGAPIAVDDGYYTLPELVSKETTRDSQAPCLAGYQCSAGRKTPCGSVAYWSATGQPNCTKVTVGYFTVGGGASLDFRTGQSLCPIGTYCSGGVKYMAPRGKYTDTTGVSGLGSATPCPGGTFGSTDGLTTVACSGVCQEGFYCPPGSALPNGTSCGGAALFCPSGSEAPVAVSPGYYTVDTSTWEMRRTGQVQCTRGYFCKDGKRVVCSEGKTIATRWYCPKFGMSEPLVTPAGHYGSGSELVAWCTRYPDHDWCTNNATTWREDKTTLTVASPCEEGFYCTGGVQTACGAVSLYCPARSSSPVTVKVGYYSTGGSDAQSRTREEICPAGSYCRGGEKIACPAGSYGTEEEMGVAKCSGQCSEGYYCESGSESPRQHECGDGLPDANGMLPSEVYCPMGSMKPLRVNVGHYPTPVIQTAGTGTIITFTVPPAYTMLQVRRGLLKDLSLSKGGLNIVDMKVILEANGVAPRAVAGQSRAELITRLTPMVPASATATDERICEPGYYCDKGVRFECSGVAYFCAPGGRAPVRVGEGNFTVGGTPTTRQDFEVCPEGSYCHAGERKLCASGYFGDSKGLNTSFCSGPCKEGFVCAPGSTSPDDSSTTCRAGYYCPSRTSTTEKECGGAAFYCPVASTARVPVQQGYYSSPLETTAMRRQNERPCEAGFQCVGGERRPCSDASSAVGIDSYYCTGGVSFSVGTGNYSEGGLEGFRSRQHVCKRGYWCHQGQRSACPVGSYGDATGLPTVECSGKCAAGSYGDREGVLVPGCVGKCSAGHWCESGSVSPRQHKCGAVYSYCPEGSVGPVTVQQKHYATPEGCSTACTGQSAHGKSTIALAGFQYECPQLGGTKLFSVLELRSTGTAVGGVKWPSSLPEVGYSLASPSPDFEVNATTGTLATKRPLSFNDANDGIKITVEVTTTNTYGTGMVIYSDSCELTIIIVDKNQAPVVSNATFELDENVPKGTVVGTVAATDTDTSRFTYKITAVEPVAWKEAVVFESPDLGKLVVGDASLIDFEALAPYGFRLKITISVDDMHPSDAKQSVASVIVNLRDVNDLTVGVEDTAINASPLGTSGSDRVCFSGVGFADLDAVNAGSAWAVTATYGGASNDRYTATSCATKNEAKVVAGGAQVCCCDTVAGVGERQRWKFQFAAPAAVDRLAGINRMLASMGAETQGTTSYAPPTIVSFRGAVDMKTSGGDVVDLVGNNFGPVGTEGAVRYASSSGDLVLDVFCVVVAVDHQGASELAMRCTSLAGYGGPLKWRVTVGGQTSAWTSLYSSSGTPISNYASPRVDWIQPRHGPTEGDFSFTVKGVNFALRSTVTIGPYPCRVLSSNHTHILAIAGGGVGRNLPAFVKVGIMSSAQNSGTSFSYDAPTLLEVTELTQGSCSQRREGGGDEGSSFSSSVPYSAATVPQNGHGGGVGATASVLHGCTRGGTILVLKGTNFGPSCMGSSSRGDRKRYGDLANSGGGPTPRACSCAVRFGTGVTCGTSEGVGDAGAGTVAAATTSGGDVPDTVKLGSWCEPLSWTHTEIQCMVEPGVGAALPVGIVAGGHYYVENKTRIGGGGRRLSRSRFTFSYDPPAVNLVTPMIVAVEGGEHVSIQGDNFGPAGTPVIVEPAQVLRCDHSNTSHGLIMCKTLPGRGDGRPVHVIVEGQRSEATSSGASVGGGAIDVGANSGANGAVLVNISYYPPRITSVDPNRGQANGPEKITIYGDSFGKSPTNVRAFIGGKPCANAAWMPENPPKYQKSYIQCDPPEGDVSGEKNITLIFSDDDTFPPALLLYDPLHFDGMYVELKTQRRGGES